MRLLHVVERVNQRQPTESSLQVRKVVGRPQDGAKETRCGCGEEGEEKLKAREFKRVLNH